MFMQLNTIHEHIGRGIIQCTFWIRLWSTEVILQIDVVITLNEAPI